MPGWNEIQTWPAGDFNLVARTAATCAGVNQPLVVVLSRLSSSKAVGAVARSVPVAW